MKGEWQMSEYRTIQIADGFYSIEQDYVRSFLVVGEQEALVIDAGLGSGELRKHIEGITKLPLTVIFTHADGDHIGGAAQFCRRLMHPSEFENYMGRHQNTVPMEAVWEGDILDLGNYRFEVILIPGHTPGSIALLEKDKHFLIGGDSVQLGKIYMFGRGRNFPAYLSSMKKLQDRRKDFHTVYASHDCLSVDAAIIPDLILAATKIMGGQIQGNEGELDSDKSIKCYRTDGVAFYAP